MRRHFKTDTTSIANSFLLLAIVAGVLNIDLFACDAVSGYHEHKVLHRIELGFNAERSDTRSLLLSVSEYIGRNDVVKERIPPSDFHTTCFGNDSFVMPSIGQVNTRPFYSSHNHTRLFNIPHRNSDEDESFILPVDVA